jgi:hypothetical protein
VPGDLLRAPFGNVTEPSILIGLDGRVLGVEPRSKISMMIMRPSGLSYGSPKNAVLLPQAGDRESAAECESSQARPRWPRVVIDDGSVSSACSRSKQFSTGGPVGEG